MNERKNKMWGMIWPVIVVVLANVFYNICQKSMPDSVNPFGALMVTYLVGAAISAVIFISSVGFSNIGAELKKLNWTSFVLAIAIVGLEVGYVFLYRAGWKVSAGSVVSNVALAVVLVFVGLILYKESISLRQIIGIAVCCAGIFLIAGDKL